MAINIEGIINGPSNTSQPAFSKTELANDLFEEHLKQQLTANASSLSSNDPKEEQKGEYDEDIEAIKSQGLHAYMRDLQEKQMEELREEILEEMGLTEEMLSKMPAEQQIKIEKMISEKIQQRLSLESAMEEDDEVQKSSKLTGTQAGISAKSDDAVNPFHGR